MDEYKASLDQLTKQYNQAIQALESAFELEKGQVGRINKLREQYSGRYTQLVYEYRQKRKVIIAEYKQSHPEWTRARKMWGWLFVIGILAAMTCCTMALPDSPEADNLVNYFHLPLLQMVHHYLFSMLKLFLLFDLLKFQH